ncbi:hypothetical protein A3D05_00195 [Candidatus Gottesmanbacteria bacterium RIFCSPHIGHO2_02_FULL_40_24]|uniref:Phage holin family protein n=1 Tax=Candidatus Gottesmanbacteria bacterium RIFCSPHIGHO2_01_FULL_40_15 TaxID=1798376 RepID=A0A1F5Z690_9BACT|nr:MAG: hypothetical protein A2777_00200 [Candidatus Gottesmanbacteria bacterium RIFCSPHIGHO2_01_FULL_40_15]OGG17771.1 MAG: hypothetical protein A3D05_00195 [Candidatus Gottesmanbacteria bacterium RIFCSPHIGHO2_02_FULL_40_24]OGG21883.1 MAG: hypothetical protein A3B48_04125 [Candidatus Gottesmanbacteria bacterium RIFCSPLOWO2_01_FULL_40_10]OGG25514.1 MAG: hypothetical protein A3E42_03665 [Candidatus Gottesmanbacteria bacterium RIFCSPHIGHO2_12_FULL_40_13]
MKHIIDLLIRSVVLLLTTYLVPGFTIDSYITAIIVALLLAILNLLVKPLLVILTLPATILTLGLFLFVINAILLLMASALIRGFEVESFGTALIASIVITLISSLLNVLIK